MKTLNTFGLYFTLRLDKEKNGLTPIYLAITVNKEKVMLALKKNIQIALWDTGRGMAKGRNDSARQINNYLCEVRNTVTNIYNELQLKDKLITAQILKSKFLGEDEYAYTLKKLIEYHNKSAKNVLDPATLKHYAVSQRYLTKFLHKQYSADDISLKELDFKFIQDFDGFLRDQRPTGHLRQMSNNGVMVHLIRLKKMMNLAYNLEWIERNPFSNYKIKMKRVNKEFLTEVELSAIESKEFEIERLSIVKDLFIFCCYTGLSYVDVIQLRPFQIVNNSEQDIWIRTMREKTEEPVNIPVLTKAKNILEKYQTNIRANYSGTVFPVLSNQKVNSYLKEISTICGIHKNLTFHMARHTFATTVTLSNGVPIETVSKILGHSKITTTQIYAKVVERKLKEDMMKLEKKLI